MKFLEYLNIALYEIWHNKLRTFLTLIGIIIGIGAVIIIVSVVQGAETFIMTEVQKITPIDLVEAFPRYNPNTRDAYAYFEMADVQYLRENEQGQIAAIAPRYNSSGTLRYEDREQDCQMVATTEEYAAIYSLQLESGRFLTSLDSEKYNSVIVLGSEVKENLFKNEDNVVGKKVRINSITFTIIGVLAKDPKSILTPVTMNDGRVYIPLNSFERLVGVKDRYNLVIKVQDHRLVKAQMQRVQELLTAKYGLANDQAPKFQVWNSADGLEQVQIIKIVLSVLLSGVAAITLLVAGIGVMNIMLVIVADRTREIGIRKALGGTRMDIMTQFVIESIFLCLVGGAFGIGAGYFGSQLATEIASRFINLEVEIPSWAIMLSIFFTTGVGLFFGIYPAVKAARLDPIKALHSE